MVLGKKGLGIKIDADSQNNRVIVVGVEDKPSLQVGEDVECHVPGEYPLKTRLKMNGPYIWMG